MCGIRTHRLPDNDYFNESAVHARYAAAATLRRVTVTATTDHTTLALTREYYRDDERTLEWDALAERLFVPASHVAVDLTGRSAPGIVAGRYHVSRLLGTGGMGAVWLAHDEVLQRPVALKQFSDERRDGGSCPLREARAAARISHPGVVQVHDVILDEDGDWLVMEALPGEPLSTIIRERGRLPVDEVRQIALQLLPALQAIHAVDLVHRDIKPSNIQVCGGDRIVLTDFGLSSPPSAGGGSRGSVAGSLRYMAPETIIDGQFGPASDLYSLGVTLYTAIEGQLPFDPGTPMSLLESARSAALAAPRHAGYLGEVLSGLLESNPGRRMDAARALSHLQLIGP
jgi:serine/threonine protein kinase